MPDLSLPLDQLPDPLPIEPLRRPFDVSIKPPGSKSLTCRAYVLAALAEGPSRIIRPLRADDTDNLIAAVAELGVEVAWDGNDVLIEGAGGRFPRGGKIHLGDGGAPTRFMIAASCLAAEPVVVDASHRMRERPIADGVQFLRALGADIEYLEQEGRLPVLVTPTEAFSGGELEVPTTVSSQFISALLLIGPFLERGIHLTFSSEVTSAGYVALTEQILSQWSVAYEACRTLAFSGAADATASAGPELHVDNHQIPGREYRIEPDASSAVYWMLAAAIVPPSKVYLPGLSSQSTQPDLNVVGPLKQAGAEVHTIESGLKVQGADPFNGLGDVDAGGMPDAAVALAAVAATATRRSTIRGLHTLRIKETDRLTALCSELARIGCTVQATDDAIVIDPSTRHDEPVVIETYNDHRMAMAFGIVGLARPGVSIANPACVSKSYPAFWSDLGGLYD